MSTEKIKIRHNFSSLSNKDRAQLKVAELVGEAISIIEAEGSIDLYKAIPLLKAVIYLYEEDLEHFKRSISDSEIQREIIPQEQARLEKNLSFMRQTITLNSDNED